MLYGLLNLSFWGYVVATLLLTHITIASVTIYLHRHQAHRALELHPAVSHFFRFWLWLTTGMRTQDWVAIHRKHHAKCETPDDPHSPQVLGIKKVLWEGAELYRAESKNTETLERYSQGTPTDWIERNVYSTHSAKGILIMLALDLVLFGVPGLTIWAIQMMWIPFWAAGIVNGVGHYRGYRNFECLDAARNLVPWGIIIGGEELHNNHHTYATSAKLSVKPWEFDIGWLYIRILQFFKLAKVKRLPPNLQVNPNKVHIDMDTVSALISNRFQVMARYSREVILPVWREEKHKAHILGNNLYRKAKTLLVRSESLVNEQDKQKIAKVLENHHTLSLVYQYRLKLQDIWSRRTSSQRELLDALQDWCKQAEATGVAALKNFAQRICFYSMQKHIAE